jgi:hypothetical protein
MTRAIHGRLAMAVLDSHPEDCVNIAYSQRYRSQLAVSSQSTLMLALTVRYKGVLPTLPMMWDGFEGFDTRPFLVSTLLKRREEFLPATVPRGYQAGYCQLQTLDTGGGPCLVSGAHCEQAT